MILTVTPDPILDQAVFVEEWQPGQVMLAQKSFVSTGGRGLSVAVALRHLGAETHCLCFLAGKTGLELLDRVRAEGLPVEPVWVEGETSVAYGIVERQHQRRSQVISSSLSIETEKLQKFAGMLRDWLPRCSWLCSGGELPAALPAGFFGWLTEEAHSAGVPVLLDTPGRHLQAALPAHPEIVKMNRQEFERTFNRAFLRADELHAAASAVRREYGLGALVITCGPDGILAFTKDGNYQACPPVQAAVSSAGAGDAASAAIVWRLEQGDGWPEALRWAAAVSASAVLTEGMADFLMEDARSLLGRVEVRTL